ncbi:MAG TPA: type II toxin-antitoxin system Phd/YefM family antitoxin [Candidatus Xenobia bacterium]|jgi:prevent-host-death family protein
MHPRSVSKSEFKPKALEFFREVERTGQELIVTDHGHPVLKIVPFADPTERILQQLKGSVEFYHHPTDPVGEKDWEALH